MSYLGEEIEKAIPVATATGGLLPEGERWGSYCYGPIDPDWAKRWWSWEDRARISEERRAKVRANIQTQLDFAEKEHRAEKLKVILRGLFVRGYDESPLDGVFGVIVDFCDDRAIYEAEGPYKLWVESQERCVWVACVEARMPYDGAYRGVRAHFPAKR